MSKQHEITNRQALLKQDGTLSEEGWAKQLLMDYNRKSVRAPSWRIKEWDYFYVLDDAQQIGITFTLADLGYMGLAAVAVLDFKKKSFAQLDSISLFPLGKIGLLPHSGDGKVLFEDKKLLLGYDYQLPNRKITFHAPVFKMNAKTSSLRGNLDLFCDQNKDTMVIATSWKEKRTAFYYNQKINCMPVKGLIEIGTKRYEFSPENAFAGMDWGRGVWTYNNRWYWGSASALLHGEAFGFNIGYGFSDRSPASENAIFYKGKIHKLDEITFHMDNNDYMKPWKFSSNDERFRMDFTPLIDRHSSTNLLLLKSIQHQVFGLYSGEVVLDDGKRLVVDSMLGFAEDVLNRW
jgi:hypothetical protein